MLGFGPPANRQARQEWWRRQIQRQKDGNLSIAEFCRRLGVSTVTFYTWKRRFREAPPASPLISESPAAKSSTANGAPTPAFLPVSIARLPGQTGNWRSSWPMPASCGSRGAVDPELLRTAIRAAGRLGDHGRGAD